MSQDQRRKITSITTSRTTTYGASSNRSALGYWIPLAFTVTAATVALGAWIWSEREHDDESENEAGKYHASGNKPVTGSNNNNNAYNTNNNTYNNNNNNPQGSGLSGAAVAAGAAGLGAAAGYSNMSGNGPSGPGPSGSQPPLQGGFQGPPGQSGGAATEFYRTEASRDISTSNTQTQQEDGFIARMSNAVGLTRTDASGRTNNSASGWASTSLAAAGSVVGAAVNAVRGSDADNQHFSDQEKWSEEADKPDRVASPRKSTGSGASSRPRTLARTGTAAEFYSGAVDTPRKSSVISSKRKTVAIIVSAIDSPSDRQEVDAHQSILAHLAPYVNTETTKILVLIHDPDLHTHPLSLISRRASERHMSAAPSIRSQSTSSYAQINTPGANSTPAHTPGDFPLDSQNDSSSDKGILAHVDPQPLSRSNSNSRLTQSALPINPASSNSIIPTLNPLDNEANALFKTLYNQANVLVDRDTSILPFTSRDGHKHILRSVQPETVYIQEPLCGTDGSLVTELRGWVRSVVVVIGDEGGMGGLVDSDEEEDLKQKNGSRGPEKWWMKESVTGVGRGVSVVESLRIGEDWQRRVNEDD